MLKDKAIGVFDSGLGGLTVVKQLMKQLPYENIVYFGDTARVPYGTKSKEAIIRFSKENVDILLKHKIKMVVVACNSSSGYALQSLKKYCNFPIVGVVNPGVRMGLERSKNKCLGVIATTATIKSEAYQKAIKKINSKASVSTQACPLFVPLVEEGWLNTKITEDIVRKYLQPFSKTKIDTLILGCTHYPLLKPLLQKVVGKNISLIDSAQAVAYEVKERLKRENLLNQKKTKGKIKFLVSDKPQEFEKAASNFLGKKIKGAKVCLK